MSRAPRSPSGSTAPAATKATLRGPDRNEVVLVGRVAAPAAVKELPSGDRLTAFRIIVTRPAAARGGSDEARRPTVDTFDCVAWAAGTQRAAQAWHKDDVVEVHGSLRRRFWRAAGAPASLCEVEVAKAKRLSRAG